MWMVDPTAKQIAVYRFAEQIDAPVATYCSKQRFESPLFPGLEIEVSKVFEQ